MGRLLIRAATAAYVAAFFISGHALAQDRIAWEPGTTFSFVQLDAWKKKTGEWDLVVTSKEGSTFNVLERAADGEVPLKVSESGTITRPMPSGNGSFDYTPVPLPLTAGAEWEWAYHYIGKNMGVPARASRKCQAVGMEDVEVPAGKFKAWKISCRGGWQSTAGSSGSLSRTMWFAPSISSIVRSDERSSYSGGTDGFFVSLVKITKP